MCMGEVSLALVLTSLLALVNLGVTRAKSSLQGGSHLDFFVLAYCFILTVELKLEISTYAPE